MARLSKSEKAHKKEVKRVESIIKRLNKKNEYRINIDVSTLSTRKLKNIHGKMDILKKGIATLTEEAYAARREADKRRTYIRREVRKLKYTSGNKVIDIVDGGSDVNFSNDGTNIPRISVYRGSEASIEMDMLMSIAEYGKLYTGRKSDTSAVGLVNKNGSRLYKIIDDARRKWDDETLVERINNSSFGSVRALAMLVEKLVLAVYDREYFAGDGFMSVWNEDAEELENILEGR